MSGVITIPNWGFTNLAKEQRLQIYEEVAKSATYIVEDGRHVSSSALLAALSLNRAYAALYLEEAKGVFERCATNSFELWYEVGTEHCRKRAGSPDFPTNLGARAVLKYNLVFDIALKFSSQERFALKVSPRHPLFDELYSLSDVKELAIEVNHSWYIDPISGDLGQLPDMNNCWHIEDTLARRFAGAIEELPEIKESSIRIQEAYGIWEKRKNDGTYWSLEEEEAECAKPGARSFCGPKLYNDLGPHYLGWQRFLNSMALKSDEWAE